MPDISDKEMTLKFYRDDGHRNLGDINIAKAVLKYMEGTGAAAWRDEATALSLAIGKADGNWRVIARPVGTDGVPGCFVCGSDYGLGMMSNICLMTVPTEAKHVCALFDGNARIAHYHGDPKAPQIKVGACKVHKASLHALHLGTSTGGKINRGLVEMCKDTACFPAASIE